MSKISNNPKVISILNMKGGVGKTTLSVNIGYILANFHSKKVLLIDIDPQFNATQYLVSQEDIVQHFENKLTVLDIIMPKKEESVNLVKKKKRNIKTPKLTDYIINISSNGGSFDILPSTLNLIEIENSERGAEHRLKKFIGTYCKHYDIIIIDCPPTLGIHTYSAFLASSYYIIPIKPDYLSSIGLSLLEKALEKYRGLDNHKFKSLGIVFTIVDLRPNLTFEIMNQIKLSGKDVFTAYSSLSTKVARSVSQMEYFYNINDRYQIEFKDITKEVLAKLN